MLILAFNNETEYETIVVVKNDINNYADLKGKKYCHPGNSFENILLTNYVLYEFEREALKKNGLINEVCDGSEDMFIKNYFKVLSNFFGSSCRPIATADDDLNKDLKTLYKSLISNCREGDGFESALKCLSYNADVAVSTIKEFNDYFYKPENFNSKQNFKFFCRDGSTKSINDNPCVWTKQPWNLIISHRYLKWTQNF